jgi:hypothetical protein
LFIALGKRVDATMQHDPLLHPERQSAVDSPLDEIAHEIPQHQLGIVSGKIEMAEKVHGASVKAAVVIKRQAYYLMC